MSPQMPTFAGWYPDPETGGTGYWDGSRWTGDGRPRRKTFAAESRYDGNQLYYLLSIGGGAGVMCVAGASEEDYAAAWFLAGVVILVGTAAACIYLLRGQGPTTQAVERRLAQRREAADAAASQAAQHRRHGSPFIDVNYAAPDVAGAAQVNAVANPETARSLQNLQNLLYTHAITDQEFQAAKDKLLGVRPSTADSFAQIAKLVELHQAGVLSDYEFAAAKARVLDL